jgi:hypothetical protein
MIDSEKEGEWTVNHYYSDTIQKVNNQILKFKEDRENYKKGLSSDDVEINDIKIPFDKFFTDVMTESVSNESNHVLNIQISCFSYWKVFEKRFIDYSQIFILRYLLYYYVKELGLILEKKFSPVVNENNITEDFSISKKRHEIITSIENLEVAKFELSKIL